MESVRQAEPASAGQDMTCAPFERCHGRVEMAEDVRIDPGVVIVPPINASEGGVTTLIGPGAVIGGNAVIVAGVAIGRNARIEVGAVVESAVPDFAIVKGNPATITGYTDTPRSIVTGGKTEVDVSDVGVSGVSIHRMMTAIDLRGRLTVGEFEKSVPFRPRRYFLVYDVPSKETRGEHAHRACHQFLICVHGSVTCVVDDGETRQEFVLSDPSQALYMPPMIWGTQYQHAPGSVMLVFASHHYDSEDYIREYGEFLVEISRQKAGSVE